MRAAVPDISTGAPPRTTLFLDCGRVFQCRLSVSPPPRPSPCLPALHATGASFGGLLSLVSGSGGSRLPRPVRGSTVARRPSRPVVLGSRPSHPVPCPVPDWTVPTRPLWGLASTRAPRRPPRDRFTKTQNRILNAVKEKKSEWSERTRPTKGVSQGSRDEVLKPTEIHFNCAMTVV